MRTECDDKDVKIHLLRMPELKNTIEQRHVINHTDLSLVCYFSHLALIMSNSFKALLERDQGRVRILEAHDSDSVEVIRHGISNNQQSFGGVWISGLTQTTYLGPPDTELISPLKRASLIDFANTLQNTGRPLCAAYDADSGGDISSIPKLIAVSAQKDISMIILEDNPLLERWEESQFPRRDI